MLHDIRSSGIEMHIEDVASSSSEYNKRKESYNAVMYCNNTVIIFGELFRSFMPGGPMPEFNGYFNQFESTQIVRRLFA